MFKKLIAVFTVGILMGSVSFAAEALQSTENFYGEMTKLSAMCIEENCEKPYSKIVTYHHIDKTDIDAKFKKILERISLKQAQIWGDTILEGDYAAEGNTRLDKVVNLYKNDELIGYQITYSEKAWDTANCLYDGINDSTLLGCIAGRISESSYVSLGFKEYFYDEKTAAVFK